MIEENTDILMGDWSWKPIKNVTENETVMTLHPQMMDHSESKILNVKKSVEKKLFKVKAGGCEIIVTEDQAFCTTLRGWVCVRDLEMDDELALMLSRWNCYCAKLHTKLKLEESTNMCNFITESKNHTFVANGFIVSSKTKLIVSDTGSN